MPPISICIIKIIEKHHVYTILLYINYQYEIEKYQFWQNKIHLCTKLNELLVVIMFNQIQIQSKNFQYLIFNVISMCMYC